MDRPTNDEQRLAAVRSPDFFKLFGDPDTPLHTDSSDAKTADDAAWAALHNAGAIDLLARCVEGASLEPWLVVHAAGCRLDRLLPALDATVEEIALFMTNSSSTPLGDSMGSNAVVRWLKLRPVVVAEIVARPTDSALSVNLFTVALQAKGSTAMARQWTANHDARIRLQAINALAWIADDAHGAIETLAVLEGILDGLDDEQRAAVIRVLFHIHAHLPEIEIVHLLMRVLALGGVIVQGQAVTGLSRTPSLLAIAARDDVVNALIASNPEASRFFSVLVRALAKGGHTDAAATMAERLGDPESTEALLSALPAAHALGVVIDWLGRDAERLGPGLEGFFNGRRRVQSPLIGVPHWAIPENPRLRVLTAMKAMCWLLLEPVTVAAILAAFLSVADENDGQALTRLLRTVVYDHAEARDYLADINEEQGAGAVIGSLLDEHDTYQRALEGMGTIVELRPSEAQRMTLRMVKERASQAMNREVHDQSSFLSLVPRSLVLHGAGVVYMIHDAEGRTTPATMKMASVTTSIALPTLSVIDPVGYDILNVQHHRADLKP